MQSIPDDCFSQDHLPHLRLDRNPGLDLQLAAVVMAMEDDQEHREEVSSTMKEEAMIMDLVHTRTVQVLSIQEA